MQIKDIMTFSIESIDSDSNLVEAARKMQSLKVGALPVWEDDNLKIFWTHLVRDISKIDRFKEFKCFDLTTVYGYGGPLIISKTGDKNLIAKSLGDFSEDYGSHARKKNYITEITRFHPIFRNWEILISLF